MTLLVGIHAEYGIEGIVLAADRQISMFDDKGEAVSKRPVTKIYHGPSWALAWYGTEYRETLAFCRRLQHMHSEESKRTIQEVIKKGRYLEINELNANITRKPGRAEDDVSSFILAVREPSLSLWEVNSFGVLKEASDENDFDYICLGSGRELAEGHIEKLIREERIDRNRVTLAKARSIARGAIEEASSLISVGLGYDMLIIAKEGIENVGKRIRRAGISAERAEEQRIDDKYKGPDGETKEE